MPRSVGFKHLKSTREKIQASQLINRLEKHVFSQTPLLDASQVNAAKALLNKVLPDLSSVQMSGDANNPIKHDVEIHIVDHRADKG